MGGSGGADWPWVSGGNGGHGEWGDAILKAAPAFWDKLRGEAAPALMDWRLGIKDWHVGVENEAAAALKDWDLGIKDWHVGVENEAAAALKDWDIGRQRT